MSLGMILLIVLILLLTVVALPDLVAHLVGVLAGGLGRMCNSLGAFPRWGYSQNWGYGPSGVLGLVLVIVLILVVLGRI